ncbi:hypothetical protein ACFSO7_11460 [Bacillus sp. CGMCC 1.16607]|uniref:hypothetical protein n=1 Tax=Bacillus sp. CGMCC 1.16607 TaxID=3351842 RepID=UPI0036440E07
MEKNLFNLKEELDTYISDQNIFTDKDKNKIRMKLEEVKVSRNRSFKFVPILATCTAGILFVLLSSPFFSDVLGGLFPKDSNDINVGQNPDSVPDDKVRNGEEKARPNIDPKVVKVGDKMNELEVELVDISENAESDADDYFSLNFNGEMELEGVLELVSLDGGNEEGERVAFYPNETSLLKLPIVKGIERDPFIILASPIENLTEYLQLKPGIKKDAMVTVAHYAIYKDPVLKKYFDRGQIVKLNGSKIKRTPPIEAFKEFQILTEELKPLYKKLVTSREETDLKGLGPMDVFRLYWQAFEYGNLEIIYFLLEGSELPDYKTFTEQTIEENFEEEHRLFEKMREKVSDFGMMIDEDSAYVTFDDHKNVKIEFFQNSSGIWKVKYLP